MSFSQWLRTNSEHYLLHDAHDRLSREYGWQPPPAEGHRPGQLFWSRVFVPVYRVLPWPMRQRVMRMMPGSHRKRWTKPPKRHNPAV